MTVLARTTTTAGGAKVARRPGMLTSLWRSQRPRVLGIIFLCLLLLGVWLTYAMFTKKFADYEEVTLEADRMGLQLPMRGDVKARGVIVGEIIEQEATSDGAEITLGIYPDKIDTIPAEVRGEILPKTLFGQKYVSLDPGDGVATADSHLRAGDRITETQVSLEVQQVLDNIYPLLRSIQPADLNNTLNALATALEGRGDKLGGTLETLDGYLKKINPQIPLLVDDLNKAAQVSDIYADVLPQISQILRDSIDVTQVLETHEKPLNTMLDDVTSLAGTTDRFLAANEQNLMQLGPVLQPTVDLLARYSTELPCMISGIKTLTPRLSSAFRDFTLHIDLEVLPNQPRRYNTGDLPINGVTGGPHCGTLPSGQGYSQDNPMPWPENFNEGIEQPTGKGTRRAALGEAYAANGASYVGTPEESAVLKELIGPSIGVQAGQVPDLGPLMVGPLTRGAKVEMR